MRSDSIVHFINEKNNMYIKTHSEHICLECVFFMCMFFFINEMHNTITFHSHVVESSFRIIENMF